MRSDNALDAAKSKLMNISLDSTRILAADIWRSTFRSDPMSQEAGLRYRKIILEKGGRDGEERAVHEFLGREPRIDAYLSDLQID